MKNIHGNRLIYLSPLGQSGISDIKRACLFFDKIFVPIAWTTIITHSLVIKTGESWQTFVSSDLCHKKIDTLLNEFEPLIQEGIIETDKSEDFHLLEKVKLILNKKIIDKNEYEEKKRFLGITDESTPIQVAKRTVLTQIDYYHPLFSFLNYTPLFNDSLAIDILEKCVKFYEQHEKTLIPIKGIKSEIGIKGDILAFNIISEQLPNLGYLNSKQILKIRDRLEGQLGAFRTEINKHCIEIQSKPYSEKSEREIQYLINTKINPLIFQLRKDIENSKDNFVLRMVKNIPSTKTMASFVFSFFAGLPMEIALGIASGINFISSLAEHKLKLKEIRNRSGLGIFFLIQKRFIKESLKISKESRNLTKKAVFLFDNAISDIEKGEHKKALKKLDEAIEMNPLVAEFWNNKGVVLRKTGKQEEALKAFQKAIKINPQYDEIHNMPAFLVELGRYKEALIMSDSLIDINPNNPKLWFVKFQALYHLEKKEKALEAINQVIELEPNSYQHWDVKAICLYDVKKYPESIASFRKAIQLNSKNATGMYNLSVVYLANGKKSDSLKYLAKAINLERKFKKEARIDEDFRELWEDENFKKLVKGK